MKSHGEVWVVVEPQTEVFSSPTEGSATVRTLKEGAQVRIDYLRGRWLKISEPAAGYVKSADLSPAAPAADHRLKSSESFAIN